METQQQYVNAISALRIAGERHAAWHLPISAAERARRGAWPDDHGAWARDWIRAGGDHDQHVEATLTQARIVVVHAGPGAGLPAVAAVCAGWRVRRIWMRASPETDVRPQRAVVRRLSVRFPEQVAADALGAAPKVTATSTPADVVALLRPGDVVWTTASADNDFAWTRELCRLASAAGFASFGSHVRPLAPPVGAPRDSAASAPPWGAWATSPPPPFPGAADADPEAAYTAEHALGWCAAWAPMGITALDGVADSPQAVRARIAALAGEPPMHVLSRIAADILHECATAGSHALANRATSDALVAASGVAWTDIAFDPAVVEDAGVLGALESAVRLPSRRPPLLPAIEPLAAIFPEVHLAPGQRHDPSEYDLKDRLKLTFTAGEWEPSFELCRDADERFRHPNCTDHASAVEPLELVIRRVVGRVFYGNLPFARIRPLLKALQHAVARDPSTRGTLILPERPWEPWFADFFYGRNPLVRVVRRFRAERPLGPVLFDYKADRGRRRSAGPIAENILVCRMGHPGVLRALLQPDRSAPTIRLPPTIGPEMLEELATKAQHMSLEDADEANPSDGVKAASALFTAAHDDVDIAREREHASELSDLEFAEARREVLGVLQPAIRTLWGAQGVRRARAWLTLDLPAVPSAEDWFPYTVDGLSTHFRSSRFFLWLLTAPTLLG